MNQERVEALRNPQRFDDKRGIEARSIRPQHRNLARHALFPGEVNVDAADPCRCRVDDGNVGGNPAKA